MKLHFVIATLLASGLCSTLSAQEKFTTKADNLKAVVKKLATYKFPEKDDFETSEQYLDRLPKWDTSKVYTFIQDAFTFYRADDSSFSISSPYFKTDAYNPIYPDDLGLWFESEKKKIRTYSASNSFGRKVTVTENLKTFYILDSINIVSCKPVVNHSPSNLMQFDSVAHLNSFVSDGGTVYFFAELYYKAPTPLAKRFHKKISVAFQFKFDGYFDSRIERDYYEPKINDPEELTELEYRCNVDPVRLVFFEKSTGTILATIDYCKQ